MSRAYPSLDGQRESFLHPGGKLTIGLLVGASVLLAYCQDTATADITKIESCSRDASDEYQRNAGEPAPIEVTTAQIRTCEIELGGSLDQQQFNTILQKILSDQAPIEIVEP